MLSDKKTSLTIDEFREILGLPNHIVAIIKNDGSFHKLNDEISSVLGWEPQEIIGQKIHEFIHPNHKDEMNALLQSLSEGERTLISDFVTKCLHKNGSWRWLSLTCRVKGDQIYCLGVDVTDRVEFEEALSVQSLVLESISEAVGITNTKGTIVYTNSALEKMYGYESNELLGKSFEVLNDYADELSRLYLKEILAKVSEKGMWIGEWVNRRKDGSTLVTSCRITLLRLNSEVHYVCVQRDITEERRSDEKWQDLQRRFRTFFEQSILPMEIYDLEGNPLEVNQAWEKLFDTTKDQLEGYNILEDPSTKEIGIYDYLLRAYGGESVEVPPFHLDPKKIGREGRARWISAWFSPVKDQAGQVKELAMILRDVTEERETQEALAFSNAMRVNVEERLSLAVKVGKVGIWEWIPDKKKIIWDETSESIFGYKKGDFPSTTIAFESHLHPDDREELLRVISESVEKKIAFDVDHRILRLDGKVRWVHSSGMAFYDRSGKAYRVMGTILDVTDRRLVEEEQTFLAEISENLSASLDFTENIQRFSDTVLDFLCDGLFMDLLKTDGSVERILLQHNDPEVIKTLSRIRVSQLDQFDERHPLLGSIVSGKNILYSGLKPSLLEESFGPEFAREVREAKMSSVMTLRLRGRESLLGTLTLFTTSGSGRVMEQRHVKLAEEIAYRVSLSLENSLLYAHSQESIKARDEFLSIASHELKTPLQSLTLQNQMRRRNMQKFGTGDKKSLKALELDYKQLTRINRLIDDMLEITRINANHLALNLEDFEFCQFIGEVVERFRPQLEASGCELSASLNCPLKIKGDSYRIEQVVVNLLTNAMKYGAGHPIKIEVQKKNDRGILYVQDRGPGIAESDIERIFERFERAISSSEVSGLGLGLFISRQIIEKHGGVLSVDSQLGTGSTFILELPIIE